MRLLILCCCFYLATLQQHDSTITTISSIPVDSNSSVVVDAGSCNGTRQCRYQGNDVSNVEILVSGIHIGSTLLPEIVFSVSSNVVTSNISIRIYNVSYIKAEAFRRILDVQLGVGAVMKNFSVELRNCTVQVTDHDCRQSGDLPLLLNLRNAAGSLVEGFTLFVDNSTVTLVCLDVSTGSRGSAHIAWLAHIESNWRVTHLSIHLINTIITGKYVPSDTIGVVFENENSFISTAASPATSTLTDAVASLLSHVNVSIVGRSVIDVSSTGLDACIVSVLMHWDGDPMGSGSSGGAFGSHLSMTVEDSRLSLTVLCNTSAGCQRVFSKSFLDPALVRLATSNVSLNTWLVQMDKANLSAVVSTQAEPRTLSISLVQLIDFTVAIPTRSAMNIIQSSVVISRSFAAISCVDVCAAVSVSGGVIVDDLLVQLLDSTLVHNVSGALDADAVGRRAVTVDFHDIRELRNSQLLFTNLSVFHSVLSGALAIASASSSSLMGVSVCLLRLLQSVNVTIVMTNVVTHADVRNGTLAFQLAYVLLALQLQVSLIMLDKRFRIDNSAVRLTNATLRARTGFVWPAEAQSNSAPIAFSSVVSLVFFFASATNCTVRIQISMLYMDHMSFPKAAAVDTMLAQAANMSDRLVQYSNLTSLVGGADFGGLLTPLESKLRQTLAMFPLPQRGLDKFERYLSSLSHPIEYKRCVIEIVDSEVRYSMQDAVAGGYEPNPYRDVIAYITPPLSMVLCNLTVSSTVRINDPPIASIANASDIYYTPNGVSNIVSGVVNYSTITFSYPPTALGFVWTVYLEHAMLHSTMVVLNGVLCTPPQNLHEPLLPVAILYVATHAQSASKKSESGGGVSLVVSGNTTLQLDHVLLHAVFHMFGSSHITWRDRASVAVRCVLWRPSGLDVQQDFSQSDVGLPMSRVSLVKMPSAAGCSGLLSSSTTAPPSSVAAAVTGMAVSAAALVSVALAVVSDVSNGALLDAQLLAAISYLDCSPAALQAAAAGPSRASLSLFFAAGDVTAGLGNVAVVVVFGALHWALLQCLCRRRFAAAAPTQLSRPHPAASLKSPHVRVRYPNLSYGVALLFAPGIVRAAARLTSSGDMLPMCAGAVCCIFALFILYGRHCMEAKVALRFRFESYSRRLTAHALLPWALPEGRWGGARVRMTFGKLRGAVRKGFERFALLPVVYAWTSQAVLGLQLPASWCTTQLGIAAVPAFLYCAVLLWYQPTRARATSVLAATSSLLIAVLCVSRAAASRNLDDDAFLMLQSSLMASSAVVRLVIAAHTVYIMVWERRLKGARTAAAAGEVTPNTVLIRKSLSSSVSNTHHLTHDCSSKSVELSGVSRIAEADLHPDAALAALLALICGIDDMTTAALTTIWIT